MHIEQFTFNAFQTRCCVVWENGGFCAIIDPGCSSPDEVSEITGLINRRGLTPVCIMLTHAHFDHIYGAAALADKYGIPVHAHSEEQFTIEETNPEICRCYGLPLPDLFPISPVSEGDAIQVGSLKFEVIETPGHSRGGLCFLERSEGILFSGDTLFAGAIGRTDHPGGDYDQLMKNILEKVMTLSGEINVIPGHGPCTDIATEGMTNPFLLPFNEPYED